MDCFAALAMTPLPYRRSEDSRPGMCFAPGREAFFDAAGRVLGECAMSLGTILIIIVIIFLLGGFSGRFRGYGYGLGHSGMGLGGVILVVLLVLILLGKL